jgi:hypothetical protein
MENAVNAVEAAVVSAAGRAEVKRVLAVATVLSVVLAIAVAWVDYLPTNDGPQHIFSAYLQDHLDDTGQGWNRYLDRGALITGSGFDHLLTVLDRILSWRSAFRLAVTGLALAWAWSVLALGASLGSRGRWLGLLGFATSLQWLFYMGLFSYYLATALGFLVLALAFRFGLHGRLPRALIAALLALQTIVHVVPAALTGLTLIVYAWLSSARDAKPRVLLGTVLVGTPAALIAAMALSLTSGGEHLNHYSLSLPFPRQVMLLGRAFVSGPAWRAWPVTLLALGTAVVVMVRWRRHSDARVRTLALAGLGQLALSLGTHLHIEGWEYFNVRFIPNAIIFLALLAPVDWLTPRRPAPARTAAAILVVFSLASMAWGWQHHRFLRRQHADLLAGLEAPLRRRGPRLPLVIEPPPGEPADDWERAIPFVTTNLHVDTLFALQQGGVPAYLFAGAGAVHALTWQHPPDGLAMPPRPGRGNEWRLWEPGARADPSQRARALAHMLSYGPAYEDVIIFGLPEDRVVLRERGFVLDFERGNVTIARFVGCPARVRIEPPAGGLPPTLLLAGWWPDRRPTFSTTLAARASNEAILVAIPQGPCGQIWIRVLFDMDGDGKLSPGDRTCRGSDASAVVQQRVGPGTETVVCAAGDPQP